TVRAESNAVHKALATRPCATERATVVHAPEPHLAPGVARGGETSRMTQVGEGNRGRATESRHETLRGFPAEALLLGTVLLWSFNFTAVRYGVPHAIDPMVYVALRWAIAGLALVAIALLRGTSLRLGRRSLAIVALASMVGVVLNQIAFSYSVHLAPA